MRLFWRILAGIGGVLLLLLIAVAIAVSTVNVKDFVGPIQKRVKEATGRELAIRGGIDLKLALEPKLVIEEVTLSNAPWGQAPQMLTAKRVEAQIALLPLLKRDFEVERFALIDPKIALEVDANGRRNWDFAATPDGTGSTASPASSAPLGGFFVSDLTISNGVLTYRDGETGKLTSVTIDDLELHARDAQSPVSARFRGTVDDIAVALEGDLGPLVALAQRRWPYPVSVKGEVNGQQASLLTKLRVEDSTMSLDPLEVVTGKSKLSGQLAVTTAKPRPKLSFKLTAPSAALADLPIAGKMRAAAGKAAPKSKYVFGEEAIDVSALKAFDASGELAIDALQLPSGERFDRVRVQLSLQDGRLAAPVMQAAALGGTVSAQLRLDATHDKDPALNVRVDAKNLDLAALLAEFGIKRDIRGGKTQLNIDIAAHGVSPRQWASSASGSATAIVGAASIGHTPGEADSAFNRLADAVNPFRKVDPSTGLQCAVIRLPLRNGVAAIDRSIAIETNKLAASATGTVDFRTEMLDLAIKPQLRQGISVDISQIAQLVRFHGPFTAPTVGIDAMATAATLARIGAAVGTGGFSLAGEALLSGAKADASAPCQVALGRAPVGDAAAASQPPAARPTDDVSKALNRLLGR